MLILGIETATWMGGVALLDDKVGVLAEVNLKSKASHSERLVPSLDRLFSETGKTLRELDGICVSIGPGSFTGLRIGLATAKGLAYAADKPLVGISTLEVLANGVPSVEFPVCPVVDARKNEVFAAIYQWKGLELICREKEMAVAPEILIKKIKRPTIFVGNGLSIYKDLFRQGLKDKAIFIAHAFNFPRASILAELGLKRFAQKNLVHPADLVPIYIRPSEAELNWKRKKQ